MAMTPMDLQKLFAQVDKIGKEVSDEREGVALRAAMEGDAQAKINGERAKSVRATEAAPEDGLRRVKGDEKRRSGTSGGAQKGGARALILDGEEAACDEGGPLTDPNLGAYVDLTG
jgi:hypothetical protein